MEQIEVLVAELSRLRASQAPQQTDPEGLLSRSQANKPEGCDDAGPDLLKLAEENIALPSAVEEGDSDLRMRCKSRRLIMPVCLNMLMKLILCPIFLFGAVTEAEERMQVLNLERQDLQLKLKVAEDELHRSQDAEKEVREREVALKEKVEVLESLQVGHTNGQQVTHSCYSLTPFFTLIMKIVRQPPSVR